MHINKQSKKNIDSFLLGIVCLFMETNKNYYQQSQIEIDKIKRSQKKPTLALHACCAPCSTFPLEFLTPIFDVTILYFNPNIYPK